MADYTEQEVREVYAALGMEMPSQQPEAADPANAGENEQGVAAPDGAGSQATAQDAAATSDQSPSAAQETGDGGLVGTSPYGGKAEDGGYPSTASRSPSPASRGGLGEELGSKGTGQQNPDAGDENSENGDASDDKNGGMSRAERAEQARLRREREAAARIDAAVQKALEAERAKHGEELKRIFATAGMTDRYNGGKPITNAEEFEAWQSRAQAERLSRQIKDGTLTPETFQQAVDSSPAVKEAKAFMERMQAQEQARQAEESKAAFERQVARELAEIEKLDPGVKSLEDILNLPTGQEFAALVRDRGLSYLEAFRLANMDRLMQARSMAAAQGAAVRQNSKAHLRSVVSSGQVPVDVPREVVAMYRQLNPDMTMEQIRQDYAAYLQSQ